MTPNGRPGPGRAGRPAVLTAELVAEVHARRSSRQAYAEIADATGLAVGTARYADWLARHGKPLCQSRLQFAVGAPPREEPSEGRPTRVAPVDPEGRP